MGHKINQTRFYENLLRNIKQGLGINSTLIHELQANQSFNLTSTNAPVHIANVSNVKNIRQLYTTYPFYKTNWY